MSTWTCNLCTTNNQLSNAVCTVCGAVRCSACTFHNRPGSTCCETCGTVFMKATTAVPNHLPPTGNSSVNPYGRPVSGGGPSPSQPPMADPFAHPSNLVPPSAPSFPPASVPSAPPSRQPAATQSTGWSCSKCTFNNTPTSPTCMMCMSPRVDHSSPIDVDRPSTIAPIATNPSGGNGLISSTGHQQPQYAQPQWQPTPAGPAPPQHSNPYPAQLGQQQPRQQQPVYNAVPMPQPLGGQQPRPSQPVTGPQGYRNSGGGGSGLVPTFQEPLLMRDGSVMLRAPSSTLGDFTGGGGGGGDPTTALSVLSRDGSSTALSALGRRQSSIPTDVIIAEPSVNEKIMKQVMEVRDTCRIARTVFFDPLEEFNAHEWACTIGSEKSLWPTRPAKDFTIFKPGGLGAEDIAQGELGDCWFLSALSVLAHRHPKLIESLFLTEDVNPEGVFAVKFWRDGIWTPFIIDSYFPSKYGKYFKYARCKENTSLWAPLIEKAYAKMQGSYEKLTSGLCSEAFYDLTGLPCFSIKNRGTRENPEETWDEDEVFQVLLSYITAQCTMGATCGGTDRHTACAKSVGLDSNHAYSLLDIAVDPVSQERVVLLRNPWGKSKYEGQKVNISGDESSKDPGSFWMNFGLFSQCFSGIDVCLTRQFIVNHSFPNITIDPVKKIPPRDVLQKMAFTVTQTCEVYAMAVQQDIRRESGRLYFDMTLLIVKLHQNGTSVELAVHSQTGCDRVTTVYGMLTPGDYVILPMSVQADKPINVTLQSEQPNILMAPAALRCTPPLNILMRNLVMRNMKHAKRQEKLPGFVHWVLRIGQGDFILLENRGRMAVECVIDPSGSRNMTSIAPGGGLGPQTFVLPPNQAVLGSMLVPLPHDGSYHLMFSYSLRMRELPRAPPVKIGGLLTDNMQI